MATPTQAPVALTIAGSDSGGGAGIQADLLTFSGLGVFGTSAITCITAQNPNCVSDIHAVPAGSVAAQIRQVASFFRIRAAKTGMLLNAEIIRAVSSFMSEHPRLKVIVDPVMVATSGALLLQENAKAALLEELIPLAAMITPNLDEAQVMLGSRPAGKAEMTEAAESLAMRFGVPVLLKGGHLETDRIVDVLAYPGKSAKAFTRTRIQGVNTHGSGCTLAAGIAALIARGEDLEDAIAGSIRYLRRGMRRPVRLGRQSFIAHS